MTHISRRQLTKKMLAAGAITIASPLALGIKQFGGISSNTSNPHHLLARGFNLPSWVDRVDGVVPSVTVLIELRRLGFSSIRLPIDPISLISGDYKLITLKIEKAIQDLNQLGFAVVLDMHLNTSVIQQFSNDLAGASKIVMAAWQVLSPILANSAADKNYAELLNEPPLAWDQWLTLRDRLASQVRQDCPKHTIIWGAEPYQSIYRTIEMPLLKDDNQIAAVHYYTPLGFTHQGASWGGDILKHIKNLPFPATSKSPAVIHLRQKLKQQGEKEALAFLERTFEEDWTKKRTMQDFAAIGKWSKNKKCPVIMNEFGVLNFNVTARSRARWIEQIRRSAEENNIGWMYWEMDHGFGFMEDRRHWKDVQKDVMNALFDR